MEEPNVRSEVKQMRSDFVSLRMAYYLYIILIYFSNIEYRSQEGKMVRW
jgi:hypothetical protein